MKKHFTCSLFFALALTFLGGFMDIVSLKFFGLFTAMQTGNTITLFLSLVDGDYMEALYRSISLISFIVFCFLGELIRINYKSKSFPYPYLALSLMAISLSLTIGLGFIPDESWRIAACSISLAFCGATQVIAFESFNEHTFVSTMMTALLKNMALSLAKSVKTKEKDQWLTSLEYALVFLCFVVGITVGYLLISFVSTLPLYVYLLIALAVVIFLLFPLKYQKLKKN